KYHDISTRYRIPCELVILKTPPQSMSIYKQMPVLTIKPKKQLLEIECQQIQIEKEHLATKYRLITSPEPF
ncbi:7662_t:CDS:2, partial [Cetraspora pellucida]